MQESLSTIFMRFGLAGLIGFAIGLERGMAAKENPHAGTRDFIMFSLIGAVSGFIALQFDNSWLIIAGFIGFLSLIVTGYWIDRKEDSGITTEVAAILTYFLGVLVIKGSIELAIALAIITLAILSQKKAISKFSSQIQVYELQAALKFLIITFIILPVLPSRPLNNIVTLPLGEITNLEVTDQTVTIHLPKGPEGLRKNMEIQAYDRNGKPFGTLTVTHVKAQHLTARFSDTLPEQIASGIELRRGLDIPWLNTMLAALNPYKIWLIVVLVSLISFVGYVLNKIFGTDAATGLTGLIGGLASSTVTTVSFARRSLEAPALNINFAVAILLASAVMFPRLLLEIAVVNQELMKNIALPVIVMGITGFGLASAFIFRSRSSIAKRETVGLANPFCLKSAISFGLIFSGILMLTRSATVFFGSHWLSVVSVVSGLVDADAIAFSLSDAQQAGIINLDWASFNIVLGAVSNTFMKLVLVLTMGNRQLFRQLLPAFLLIGATGIITALLTYNL